MRRVPHLTGLEELDIAGKGVALNHNVNSWKYNRQFISRALLTPSFSAYAVIWSQRLVEEMMEFWKDASNDDGCFETDLVEWAHRFTTDSITHFTTGKKIHAVEALHVELLASKNKIPKKCSTNNLTNATRLFKSIRTLVIGIYFFIIVPSWMRNYLPFLSNTNKNYLKNRDWLFNKFDEIIKQRRKEIEHTPRDQPLRLDMLTSMITINTDRSLRKFDEEHCKPLTDEEIRGTLWETWVAGMDTTANLFTFIVYYLAHYPDILKRLREELDQFFEKLGDRQLDYKSLSKLVYTEAILKEVSRILTPAPYTARNSTAEDVLEGCVWPEETQYIINLHGINHSKELWDKPEKFNPDRWLDDTKSEKLMPYVVFGGGRRVCPGRKLTIIELKCLIAIIYHKLDIELVDEKASLKTRFILLRSFYDLQVRIKSRKID
ncbi:9404_t:CDS:2 [Paraglomus occultum]|uniref:9404_t:CDS:1 n=1 Tax=Paraglomus occultum TaxID=144539 RepID=A0A9N8VLR2_9GLOM|nr:9404_t:CDS:2 [Paraglomus occultum]